MSAPLEPVTKYQLKVLRSYVLKAHGAAGLMISGLDDVDLAKGRRPASHGVYEMWSTDKKKITIALTGDGGLIVSCSKTEDPEYPI